MRATCVYPFVSIVSTRTGEWEKKNLAPLRRCSALLRPCVLVRRGRDPEGVSSDGLVIPGVLSGAGGGAPAALRSARARLRGWRCGTREECFLAVFRLWVFVTERAYSYLSLFLVPCRRGRVLQIARFAAVKTGRLLACAVVDCIRRVDEPSAIGSRLGDVDRDGGGVAVRLSRV